MNDLYGQPGIGLSTDDAVEYLPNYNGTIPSVQDRRDEYSLYHGTKFLTPTGRPTPPAPTPAPPPPAKPKIMTWPEFKASAPDADQSQLYDAYVSQVLPGQLGQLGYQPTQVEKTVNDFKGLVARPEPKVVAPPTPPKGTKTGLEATASEALGSLYNYGAGFAAIPYALGLSSGETYKDLKAKGDALRAESAAPGSFEEMQFGENFLPYLRQLALGSLPYMAEFVLGAGVGSLASAGLRATVRETAKAALEVAAREGAESAASIAAQQTAAKAVLNLAGRATTVGAATSYPSSVGQLLSAQDEQKQQMDIKAAALLGIPYAAFNKFGGFEALAGRVLAGDLGKSATKNVLLRSGLGAVKSGAEEGGQEVAQQGLEEIARKLIDPNYKFDEKAIARLRESFIGGALLGGVPGAVVGALDAPRAAAAPGAPVVTPVVPPVTPETPGKTVLSEEELNTEPRGAPALTPEEFAGVQDFTQPPTPEEIAEIMAVPQVAQATTEEDALAAMVAWQLAKEAPNVAEEQTSVAPEVGAAQVETPAAAVTPVEPTAQSGEPGAVVAGAGAAAPIITPAAAANPLKRTRKSAKADPVQQAVDAALDVKPAGSSSAGGLAQKPVEGRSRRKRGPENAVSAVNPAVTPEPVVPTGTAEGNAVAPGVEAPFNALTDFRKLRAAQPTPVVPETTEQKVAAAKKRFADQRAAELAGVKAKEAEAKKKGFDDLPPGTVVTLTEEAKRDPRVAKELGGESGVIQEKATKSGTPIYWVSNAHTETPVSIFTYDIESAVRPSPKSKNKLKKGEVPYSSLADLLGAMQKEIPKAPEPKGPLRQKGTKLTKKEEDDLSTETVDRTPTGALVANRRGGPTLIQLLRNGEYSQAVDLLYNRGSLLEGEAALYKAIASNDPKAALEAVAKHSKLQLNRLVARFMLAANIYPNLQFANFEKPDVLGRHSIVSDTASLDAGHYLQYGEGKFEEAAYTLLHELVHAGTTSALSKAFRLRNLQERAVGFAMATNPTEDNTYYAVYDKNIKKVSEDFESLDQAKNAIEEAKTEVRNEYGYLNSPSFKAAKRIFDVFDYIKGRDVAFSQHYGSKNPLELVAEVLVKPELQEYLKKVRLPTSITGQPFITNAWTWFIKEIKALLGAPGIPDNALDLVIRDVTGVLRDRALPYGKHNATIASRGERVGLIQLFNKYGSSNASAIDRTKPYTTYDVIDGQTGKTVGSYTNKTRARNQRDKLDNEYGAVRYRVTSRQVEPEASIKDEIYTETKTDNATLKVMQNTPRGAILGVNKQDGSREYIAYPRKNGRYDLYKVEDPTTPEGAQGDPESKIRDVTEDAVRALLAENNSDIIKNTREDFGGPPKNNATQITLWKDGNWVFAAYKQSDGSWNVYQSEDLHNRSIDKAKTTAPDVDAVEEIYAGKNFSRTEKQSIARQKADAEKNLTQVEYKPPSQWAIQFTDLNGPVKYLGYQIAKALMNSGLHLPEELRVDFAYILKNSNAQNKINDAIVHEIKPLLLKGKQLIKQSWVGNEERLAKLHTALVVAERNPKIAQLYTPDIQAKYGAKNAQGLADALNTLSTLTTEQRATLEAYAREWKKFSDKTVDMNRDFGFLSAKAAENIKKAYNFYAPLGDRTPRVGKTATGQSAEAESIYSKLQKQRFDSIVTGVDNQAKQSILTLLNDYVHVVDKDGESLFTVAPMLGLRRDPQTGRIEEYLDSATMNRNSVVVYRDGEPVRILVNDKDMVKALDAFPNRERNTVLQKMLAASAMFNYVYGATKTLLSPVFGVRNVLRDVFTTFTQLDRRIPYNTFVKSLTSGKVWAGAFREGYASVIPSLMEGNSAGATLARDAQEHGAFISRKHMLGLDRLNNEVASSLDPSLWSKVSNAAKFEGPLFGFLSGITKTFENATRLAIYNAGIESGLSPMQSGIAAKTGTVNFEPKGAMAGFINPFYVFANAKLQGIRTLGQNLGAAPNVQEANLRTQVAAGAAVATGILAGLLLWQNSEKDKDGKKRAGKIPDYKKDNFIVFDEGVFGVPIPQELGAFYVFGNAIADAAFGDKEDRLTAATVRFATNMVQNFWPSGSAQYDPIGAKSTTSDYLARMAVPTPFMALYDISQNKTTFGSEIVTHKEDLAKRGVPIDMMNRRTASPAANFAAQHSFGAPQQWDYIFNQIVGPQINMAKWIAGSEPRYPGDRVNPFAKTFMPDVSRYADKETFDTIQRKVEEAHTRWKSADLPDKPRVFEQYKKELQLYAMFHAANNQTKKLFTGIDKMTPEARAKADESASDIRSRALRRYYEVTGSP